MDLVSSGAIIEARNDAVIAKYLKGSADGNVTLAAKNTIGTLESFATGNGAFLLRNTANLDVTGHIDTGSGALTLLTQGSDCSISISGELDTTGTLTLDSTGEDLESPDAAIIANTLNVTAYTGIDLVARRNKIAHLGTDKTRAGENKVKL